MSTPGDAGSTVTSMRSVLTESIRSATAAPSLHNSQPWLFHIGDDRVDVYADRQSQLEVLDPAGRELLISVGAAVFTLRLAMQHRGYRPDLSLFPDQAQPDLVARVTAGPPAAPTHDVDRLATAIPHRHTNRWPFTRTVVSMDLVTRSAAICSLVQKSGSTASTRKTRDGQTIRYLQLAHNEWDPQAKASKTRVLYSFGREDQLDVVGVRRLVDALCRLLDPADALTVAAPAGLSFVESRPLGGGWLLDGLWRRLGIDTILHGMLGARHREVDVERVLFALVANRALKPSSKLAAADWVCHDVHLPGLPFVTDDACYRAMDQLIEVEPALTRAVYDQIADLLNLEVDLLFFDTTSTYFELDEADEPLWRDAGGKAVDADDPAAVKQAGFRTHGKSKDSRDDLPQVVVGMAVTRTGIPVRVWCWPGNTGDSTLIRQVKTEMRDWNLARIVWVADRGFASAENRRFLQRAGGHYILGEKLRAGTAEADAALARQGRYATVTGNLQVKEVNIDADDRFIICYNPEAADRDAAIRERLLAQLASLIDGADRLGTTKRAELRGVISTKPGLNRFLRVTPGGLLRVDAAKVKAEQRLDGKYLLRCSDPKMSAEDIALGYKQLLEVERGWRDMKTILDLRPVYHRREDRIRAHILLCWLALLLIRVAETSTGHTWNKLRAEIDRIHVGVFTGPAGTFTQRTELSQPQKTLLAKLNITAPPRVLDATPATG